MEPRWLTLCNSRSLYHRWDSITLGANYVPASRPFIVLCNSVTRRFRDGVGVGTDLVCFITFTISKPAHLRYKNSFNSCECWLCKSTH